MIIARTAGLLELVREVLRKKDLSQADYEFVMDALSWSIESCNSEAAASAPWLSVMKASGRTGNRLLSGLTGYKLVRRSPDSSPGA